MFDTVITGSFEAFEARIKPSTEETSLEILLNNDWWLVLVESANQTCLHVY